MGIWRCCGEYVGFEKVEFSCFGGGRETESDTVPQFPQTLANAKTYFLPQICHASALAGYSMLTRFHRLWNGWGTEVTACWVRSSLRQLICRTSENLSQSAQTHFRGIAPRTRERWVWAQNVEFREITHFFPPPIHRETLYFPQYLNNQL